MSVMECRRKGCENILCDRYSDDYGYICDGCFRELSEGQFTDIDLFMSGEAKVNPVKFDYNSIFPL